MRRKTTHYCAICAETGLIAGGLQRVDPTSMVLHDNHLVAVCRHGHGFMRRHQPPPKKMRKGGRWVGWEGRKWAPAAWSRHLQETRNVEVSRAAG
jgi:hypothetical protein